MLQVIQFLIKHSFSRYFINLLDKRHLKVIFVNQAVLYQHSEISRL